MYEMLLVLPDGIITVKVTSRQVVDELEFVCNIQRDGVAVHRVTWTVDGAPEPSGTVMLQKGDHTATLMLEKYFQKTVCYTETQQILPKKTVH